MPRSDKIDGFASARKAGGRSNRNKTTRNSMNPHRGITIKALKVEEEDDSDSVRTEKTDAIRGKY